MSSNALKHGLTGRDVVLPGENPDDFESFRAGLLSSMDPQGHLEGALAEKIVADLWRLRRVPIFEAALYRRGCKEFLVKQAEESVRQYEYSVTDRVAAALEEKDVAPGDQPAHEKAQLRLTRERAELLDDSAFNLTRVLEKFPEAFANLWRHEAALSRSWLRTLHELERLQARRTGQHVPAPAVVDVDVNLAESPRADIAKTGLGAPDEGNQQ